MQIDVSRKIQGLDAKDLDVEGEPLMLASVIVNAMMASPERGDQDTGEQKLKRYRLGMKVLDGGMVEISNEDAVLINARVGQFYGPLVVGQVYDILESGGG